MDKINELNLAYVKRFMKKKRGWVDQNAVSGLKNIEKGGGHIDRANIKALGHGDLYTKKEETEMQEGILSTLKDKLSNKKEKEILASRVKRATAGSTPQDRNDWMGKTKVNEGDHRKKLQDLLGKHNNASKIDSIPQTFHKMMATRVAAILMNDTEKAKVMKGLAAQELAKMKEDELIDPNVMINEDVVDEAINRPPKKGFHIVQHKDSGQHVMVKTKTIGGAQGIKFHTDSKYQHVGAFKSKKHAKGYMDKYLSDKNASMLAKAGTAKKHDSGLGIRESVSFKRWSGPFSGKIASARTGTDKIPMSPEDEKMMLDPNSTREQRLGVARKKMAVATANAKKKITEARKAKAKSWNPPDVQEKAKKEKKERKMFASGKREIDHLKKAGK